MSRDAAGGGAGGMALPVLLLVILALSVLAHGTLLLARDTLGSARAEAGVTQRRVAAEAGVRDALDAWRVWGRLRPLLWDGPIVAEGRLGPRAGYRVRVRSLGPEFRLLEGEGTTDGGGAAVRVGRVVWLLDPVARLGAARAAVEAGGVVRLEPGSTLSGSDVSRPPDGWPADVCRPYREALDSLFPAGVIPQVGALPPGEGGASGIPGLGLLSADTLSARADFFLPAGARVSPAPDVEDGECVAGPSNWGDPGDPSASCGVRLPLVAGAGSLIVDGGEGQGILVVPGDLVVTGGALLHGIVLVGGGLEVGGGSRIEGLVRAGGDVMLRDGGSISARGCVGLRALDARPDLRRPVLPTGGSWLSPL